MLNKPHLASQAILWNDEPEIHETKSIDVGHGVSKTEPDSPVRTRPYCEKDKMGRFDNGLRLHKTSKSWSSSDASIRSRDASIRPRVPRLGTRPPGSKGYFESCLGSNLKSSLQ